MLDSLLYQGDCLEVMQSMDAGSVQTCITSPPYYGLRSYLDSDDEDKHLEVGTEETPDAYVAKLVEVFHEVRRVLREDGTLWLNLGDSYSGSNGNGTVAQTRVNLTADKFSEFQNVTGKVNGLKPKDLIGIPWRVAFALQADGWYLRSDIIWHKPNPMPESVKDRPTKAHEYIFLLSKSAKYYYDADAVAEPSVYPGDSRHLRADSRKLHEPMSIDNGSRARTGNPTGATRNRRSVWTVTTRPYKGAHFATFPVDLIEPCVLAGSKPGDIVLDPFNGAATTGLVALKHGRRYIGIDLNPDYLALSCERLEGLQAGAR